MKIQLKKGWGVIQDIHELGEFYQMYKADFDPLMFGLPKMTATPPWQPIDRLEHLQLTLADNPYYGFGLRQFNEHPWWYRNIFDMPNRDEYAVLTFKGVDYFADVWLNETYLGSHEGYQNPFTFEVGHLLKDKDNLLVVKVRAPWENNIMPGLANDRFLHLIRDQMKGTYEHSDTFIPRDVNPIGIWNDVEMETYSGFRLAQTPSVVSTLNEDFSHADVKAEYKIISHRNISVDYRLSIRLLGEPQVCDEKTGTIELKEGTTLLSELLMVENPKLWTVWDWGYPYRYTVTLTIEIDGKSLLKSEQNIGIRKIDLVRTPDEMYYILNGEKIYLRGATYFPDTYISANSPALYHRDITNAKACGLNTWRIHVHVEKDCFYDMCDEAGILLMQDSDFNWTHPTTEEWTERALKIFGDTVIRLKNHPCIFSWVLLNEARQDSYITERPGPQMMELIERLDPQRPYILNSWAANDLYSGDSHNYEGSLHGIHTHYTNIFDWQEKFNTEFGMDAPPVYSTLRDDPEIIQILGKVNDGVDRIHEYQYRYIKYFIEHYRLHKFSPCGGHYQFLFTDVAPTSHFGVYDRRGIPKLGQKAMAESNQPIAVIMEAKRYEPVSIHLVNDTLKSLGKVSVRCLVTDESLNTVHESCYEVEAPKNCNIRVSDLHFAVEKEKEYTVRLTVTSKEGELITENLYVKAFNHPEHVPGHPYQMHHGLALRAYWAWLEDEK